MHRYDRLKKMLLYVVLVCIAVIAIFPFFYILMASFRTNMEIFEYALPFTWKTLIPQEWTFNNYIAIFEEFHYGVALKNTLMVVVILVPLVLTISALGGFVFAFFDFKGKNVLFSLCLISFMIPTDAIALPLYDLVSDMGMVNTYWGMIFPSAASGLEAARIDGANWLQIFGRIVLPLSVPVTITAGLMVFVNEWNNFFWPLLAARKEEIRTLQVALSYFSDENEVFFSYIFAGAAISAIVPVLLFLPLQKYFVQGISSSGVKG